MHIQGISLIGFLALEIQFLVAIGSSNRQISSLQKGVRITELVAEQEKEGDFSFSSRWRRVGGRTSGYNE